MVDKLEMGKGASQGIAVGPVKFIKITNGGTERRPVQVIEGEINEGDILATEMTNIDLVPQMRKAAAIITAIGGKLCHAAIVSRELSKPCVVGLGMNLYGLKNGQEITVDGTNGVVYIGRMSF